MSTIKLSYKGCVEKGDTNSLSPTPENGSSDLSPHTQSEMAVQESLTTLSNGVCVDGLQNQTQPPASSSPILQRTNSFFNMVPIHPPNLANPVRDPHRMSKVTLAALAYCFSGGLAFNAILAQVVNPNNVSFRVQLHSILLNIALCLIISANWIFPRTHPNMAFVLDQVALAIVLISAVIAATPTISVYVSIGCVVIMIIVYLHQHFFNK